MDDDKELEELEALYSSVMPEEKILGSEEEDTRILNLAMAQLDSERTAAVVPIARYKKARVMWSGFSIAAGVLIGILFNPISDSRLNQFPFGDEQIVYMGEGAERQLISLDELDAPELQTLIAELVLRGELDSADELLSYLRSRYPELGTTSEG
jgi:hypothetical protein